MPTLRPAQGAFNVGATTCFTKLEASLTRTIGNAKLANREPALLLQEVAFTAYYPTASSQHGGRYSKLNWLTSPLKETLRGYAHFTGIKAWLLWPVVYLYGRFLKIPVVKNGPLLAPISELDAGKTQWPLVIFSHGLGGTSTAYSQLCTHLAASGKVVIALEHRDGTSTSCMINGKDGKGRSTVQAQYYFQDDDVHWDSGTDPQESPNMRLRTEQLEFRRHELYLAYSALRSFVDGDESHLEILDGEIDRENWTKSVRYSSDVGLAGHSFGAATVLSLLSNGLPNSSYEPIPITTALLLDPYLDPLPSLRSPNGKLDTLPEPSTFKLDPGLQLLTINSTEFTLWTDHFDRLKLYNMTDSSEPTTRRLLTIVDSKHVSFSDFSQLPFVRTKAATILMNTVNRLASAHLDGYLEDALATETAVEMKVEYLKGKDAYGVQNRRLAGRVGDVIIH